MSKRQAPGTPAFEPPMGDGRTDFDDDVQLELVGGLAVAVPASLARSSPDTKLALRAVASQSALVRQALVDLESDVREARESGASWGAIGWVLGMTGEGVRKRFGGTN